MRALILGMVMMLQGCVALGQEDLEFIDFTQAVKLEPFTLKDMRDETDWVSKDHCEGKKLLLEFYFERCPACNDNADNVKKLWEKVKDKACVVEVSIDCEKDSYDSWIDRHEPKWPVLNDCDRKIARPAGASRFPTTVILDKNYNEAMRSVGVWSSRTYDRILQYMGE